MNTTRIEVSRWLLCATSRTSCTILLDVWPFGRTDAAQRDYKFELNRRSKRATVPAARYCTPVEMWKYMDEHKQLVACHARISRNAQPRSRGCAVLRHLCRWYKPTGCGYWTQSAYELNYTFGGHIRTELIYVRDAFDICRTLLVKSGPWTVVIRGRFCDALEETGVPATHANPAERANAISIRQEQQIVFVVSCALRPTRVRLLCRVYLECGFLSQAKMRTAGWKKMSLAVPHLP